MQVLFLPIWQKSSDKAPLTPVESKVLFHSAYLKTLDKELLNRRNLVHAVLIGTYKRYVGPTNLASFKDFIIKTTFN